MWILFGIAILVFLFGAWNILKSPVESRLSDEDLHCGNCPVQKNGDHGSCKGCFKDKKSGTAEESIFGFDLFY